MLSCEFILILIEGSKKYNVYETHDIMILRWHCKVEIVVWIEGKVSGMWQCCNSITAIETLRNLPLKRLRISREWNDFHWIYLAMLLLEYFTLHVGLSLAVGISPRRLRNDAAQSDRSLWQRRRKLQPPKVSQCGPCFHMKKRVYLHSIAVVPGYPSNLNFKVELPT
jgi:hypothetical protein